jgi:hypothetical protein
MPTAMVILIEKMAAMEARIDDAERWRWRCLIEAEKSMAMTAFATIAI